MSQDAGLALRKQTRCELVVRFAWEVAVGHHHPDFTFTCAEDWEMAATAARYAAEVAPRGIRFLGACVSATGGRTGPWDAVPAALIWPPKDAGPRP